MERAGYRSNRELARDLGTDGSLVGKWLSGEASITSAQHRARLPKLLKTPAGYFDQPTRLDRLAALEAEVAEILRVRDAFLEGVIERLDSLEGEVRSLNQRVRRRSSGDAG